MRFLTLSTSIMGTTLLLAGYAANAQTPSQVSPPAMINNAHVMARANNGAIDSSGDGAIPALALDVQSSNGITYINGGIGDEEVAELKAKKHQFNVHLLVSAPGGEFISDVTLSILDSKGNALLSVKDAGPYVYALLQPGAYTLEATAGGEKKSLRITVPQNGSVDKELAFREAGGVTSPHAPTATID